MQKILVVEDDELIGELERDYLEANGYEVTLVYDGDGGVKEGKKEEYNLILLDIMLPKKNGFEICREIRKEVDTPILFVTARKEDFDKIRGLGLGANDYIVKPFNPSELVARVKAQIAAYERVLKKVASNTEIPLECVEIKDLTIYPSSRKILVKGKEVSFKNKEFEMLYFFVSNPNIVFSKNTLFDRIWGMDSLGDTATVTVHINRLREKIEEDSSKPKFIETIWGAGYRFNI